MFQMSPEDKLRQVVHYQDEQRGQMARERMANAASARPTIEPSGARSAASSGSHHSMTARHLLQALTGKHGVAQSR